MIQHEHILNYTNIMNLDLRFLYQIIDRLYISYLMFLSMFDNFNGMNNSFLLDYLA